MKRVSSSILHGDCIVKAINASIDFGTYVVAPNIAQRMRDEWIREYGSVLVFLAKRRIKLADSQIREFVHAQRPRQVFYINIQLSHRADLS